MSNTTNPKNSPFKNGPLSESIKPRTAIPLPKPKPANIGYFQCGDKSHEIFRHEPELESRIRHFCNLPKIQDVHKDSRGRSVTTIDHRAVVTHAMVNEFHQDAKAHFEALGNEVKPAPKKEDKALTTDRKELQDDEWEVIDDVDVDDSLDGRG